MDVKEVVSKLCSSSLFSEWRSSHKDDFLAHVFVMLDCLKRDSLNSGDCQVGFFDCVKNCMTTFFVDGSNVRIVPDQEILKSDSGIFELDVGSISFGVESALDCACSLLRREYSAQNVLKTFLIVQQLNGIPVFNITFFSSGFKTFNVKVSAVDCSVVHHSVASVAAFG